MAQKPQNPAAAEQPKKRGKLLLIVVSLATVLLGGGGGAAWFFMKPGAPSAQAVKPKPALFLPLEVFTANLMPDEGQAQFIQVGLTLKLTEQDIINLVKERMPEVRNRILLVLSGKRGSDLLPLAGKERLAIDIAAAVHGVIAPLIAARPASEAKAAEGEEPPAAEDADGGEAKAAVTAKPVQKGPAMIEVLFTAFMIQ